MQYKQLSEKLAEIGRPIPPLGLRRIEDGERRVDVDDLMALAVALDVNPVALLLPSEDRGVPVEATGVGSIGFKELWRWSDGVKALRDSTDATDSVMENELRGHLDDASFRNRVRPPLQRVESVAPTSSRRGEVRRIDMVLRSLREVTETIEEMQREEPPQEAENRGDD
ncbi:hypothetical protein [Citricoccus sp. SGAir0253]|uniref:hypothetical protein n=1 Tax=Citricoccus sp. SGAir0253 TaxID=2567881 RepID=UPI001AEFDBFA|nr:hypothetical protein [Citricoccus sp. SGAir0253]